MLSKGNVKPAAVLGVLLLATACMGKLFVPLDAPASTTEPLSIWAADTTDNIAAMKAGTHNPYRDFNDLINGFFYEFSGLTFLRNLLYSNYGDDAGYYLACYIRDYVLGTLVYWVTAGLWHITIYHIYAEQVFTSKGRAFPSKEVIVDQMKLAQASITLYVALPIFSEFIIENNLTKVYYYVDEVGGYMGYLASLVAYIALVEIGIYWMHRTLHTNKFLYKYIHSLHHKYNKESSLTPWASIAFNPIDGILQASPYVVCLFILPVHYLTHICLLFFSGMWATFIHDAMWADVEPIMGNKYHTMHHTHYHYNFGQFFTFCDAYWGTLRVPTKKEVTDKKK